MTAVIGILNKTGVALAADSAVTVTGANKNKIYNTANKIFTLSKYKPIGIMLYNSASFMTVPWETIIKLYRDYLGEYSFDTVNEYQADFIKFLKENDYFTSIENQKVNFGGFVHWNLDILKKNAQENIDKTKGEKEQIEEIVENIVTEVTKTLEKLKKNKEILETFSDYTFEEFKKFSEETVGEIFNSIFEGIEFPENFIDVLIEQYYHHFRSKHYVGSWTGLVFAGFGQKEIYPTIRSIRTAEVLDNRLRYFVDKEYEISDNNSGTIVPYAQIDVIQTIIEGINPDLDNTFIKTFEQLLQKYNNLISDIVKESSEEIAEKVKNLDLSDIVTEYRDELSKVKQLKQVSPTVQTVAILSKEDLAEMAESLIYLTYLKRRISSDEESVGGPIDVAIISKGDGFIWKKRKHYFDPNLNIHFFDNYFKK